MGRLLPVTAAAVLAACSTGGPGFTPPDSDAGDVPGDTTGGDASDVPTDAPFSCVPGEWACFGNIHYLCADDGVTRLEETVCPEACDPELGCVVCRPGSRTCDGNVSMICAPDGEAWWWGRDCTEWDSVCGGTGYCSDPCGDAESTHSYVGCEYWPTPLANTDELESRFDYRVVVANPNEVDTRITVTRGGSEVHAETIAPGGLAEIVLPWVDGQSFGVTTSSIITADGAYRLTSDRPVTVSQFNPFEYNVASGGGGGPGGSRSYSYTNDATLLLPQHVLTGDYTGLSYVPLSISQVVETGGTPVVTAGNRPDYIAVVGVVPGETHVQVHVAGNTAADADGAFDETARGGSVSFVLRRGEVAHVASSPTPTCTSDRPGYEREDLGCTAGTCQYLDLCREIDHDLTGSRIVSDQPVVVFGGHVCAYVPYNAQACDHLEVQLPPIQTLGTSYVSAPMVDAGTSHPNLVRIIAAFDETAITVEPPQGGFSTDTINADQYVEFMASTPFQVTGSQAIMVGQFLLGQHYPDPPAERGDPAMTVLVPSQQYRADYTFINPTSYREDTNGQNYVMIVRPPGLDLVLDGGSVSATWQSVGGSEIATVPVAGGTHLITGTSDFGMISFGLGSYTSYAYPAGLNLEPITPLI